MGQQEALYDDVQRVQDNRPSRFVGYTEYSLYSSGYSMMPAGSPSQEELPGAPPPPPPQAHPSQASIRSLEEETVIGKAQATNRAVKKHRAAK